MRLLVIRTVLCSALLMWPLLPGATETREAVVAVSAPGAAGVLFKTDLVLTNLGSGDASCTLTLLAPAPSASTLVTIPEGEGVLVVEDVFALLAPGVVGVGGLLVECVTAVGVTSRTYAEDGSTGADLTGQNIHGFGLNQQLTSVNPLRILGVSQSPTYRTNVTFINVGPSAVTVTITREANGATENRDVIAGSLLQVNSALQSLFGVSDSMNEALGFNVATGGPVVVLGTLLDNASADPATLAAIPAGGVAGPLVLPALKDPDLFTDLDLFNPGTSAAAVTLTYSAGASTVINLDPGSTSFADLLTTLGVSSATGALEVSSANPLLAQARYSSTGVSAHHAALPAQSDLTASFVQRLGALTGVSSATTIVSSRGPAAGYKTMAQPSSPQPTSAAVRTYSIGASQAAATEWTVAPSGAGSVAEFTTDNEIGVLSFLISARNENDIMVTPFHVSGVPRPFIQEGGYSCTPGTAVFTARPDWPGLAWEWFADGAATGLTTKSIDASPGVAYHVRVTDPFFLDPGISRPAALTPPSYCDGFESGDLSGWD